MEIIIYLLTFTLGAITGTLLNLFINWIPDKTRPLLSMGECPGCRAQLTVRFPAPFVGLTKKCDVCGNRYSFRYISVDITTGALFVLALYRFGLSFQALLVCFVAAVLIVITMIDIDTLEIPNGLLIILAVPAIISVFLFPETDIISRAIGFFAISLPIALIILIKPEAFGFGDVKLLAVTGFMLGWQGVLLAMFIAVITGSVYGVYLLARKATRGQTIAFGPFICGGVLISMFCGSWIIGAYLELTFT